MTLEFFLEWESNNRELQIISGKFQNNAINDVKQISLSHVIIKSNLRRVFETQYYCHSIMNMNCILRCIFSIKSLDNLISSFLYKCFSVGWYKVPLGSAITRDTLSWNVNETALSYPYIWRKTILELGEPSLALKLPLVSSFSPLCKLYHFFLLFQRNLRYGGLVLGKF